MLLRELFQVIIVNARFTNSCLGSRLIKVDDPAIPSLLPVSDAAGIAVAQARGNPTQTRKHVITLRFKVAPDREGYLAKHR